MDEILFVKNKNDELMVTEKCIICGKRATNYSGHVVLRKGIGIISGRCDKHRQSDPKDYFYCHPSIKKYYGEGCFGDYDRKFMGRIISI